jgi:hypothetical protein
MMKKHHIIKEERSDLTIYAIYYSFYALVIGGVSSLVIYLGYKMKLGIYYLIGKLFGWYGDGFGTAMAAKEYLVDTAAATQSYIETSLIGACSYYVKSMKSLIYFKDIMVSKQVSMAEVVVHYPIKFIHSLTVKAFKMAVYTCVGVWDFVIQTAQNSITNINYVMTICLDYIKDTYTYVVNLPVMVKICLYFKEKLLLCMVHVNRYTNKIARLYGKIYRKIKDERSDLRLHGR